MARITVEDCLEHESNRFVLVKLASIRAKQLLEGKHPVTDTKGNRAIVSALREIAVGKVHFSEEEENTTAIEASVPTQVVEQANTASPTVTSPTAATAAAPGDSTPATKVEEKSEDKGEGSEQQSVDTATVA